MYLYPEAIVPIDSGNVLVAGTSGITLYDASMDKISSVNTTSGQSLGSKALVDITDGTIYYVYHKSTDNILHLCKIDSGVTRIVTDYDYTALAVSGDSIIRFVHNGVAITDGLHSYKLKFKILSI
jgi:hypothetical protein